MQTTSDGYKGEETKPTSTAQRPEEDHRNGAAAVATELGRHYGEHGHASNAGAGPSAHDPTARDAAHNVGTGEQTRSAVARGTEAARDIANRAREQAGSAIAKTGETAQSLANRAREQAGPAARAVYDQGARTGEYVARSVHEYPATALLVAAAVGYGLAYLLHRGGSRREIHNRYDQGAH